MTELLATLGWLALVYVAYRLGRESGKISSLGDREAVERMIRDPRFQVTFTGRTEDVGK